MDSSGMGAAPAGVNLHRPPSPLGQPVDSNPSSKKNSSAAVTAIGLSAIHTPNLDHLDHELEGDRFSRGGAPNLGAVNGKMSGIAAGQNITPQTQVLVEPVEAAPLDPVAEIERISKLAEDAKTSDIPSQKILNDIIKTFDKLEYTDIKLSSALGQDMKGTAGGKKPYQVEPYFNSESQTTCYRIKVDYTVTANSNGVEQKIAFSRTISTSATNPADAILIAFQFKKRVEEYATFDTSKEDPSVKASRSPEFNQQALLSKTFSFSFDRNPAGGLTRLSGIQIMKDKTFLEHKLTPDNATYGYKFRNEADKKAATEDTPGHVFFETEEQLLMHENGIVTLNRNYEDLEKTKGALESEAQVLQEDIKKKQAEFVEIKGSFLKDPFLKFLRKNAEPSLSPEFANFTDVSSPKLGEYLAKKKELEINQKKQQELEADLLLLENFPTNLGMASKDNASGVSEKTLINMKRQLKKARKKLAADPSPKNQQRVEQLEARLVEKKAGKKTDTENPLPEQSLASIKEIGVKYGIPSDQIEGIKPAEIIEMCQGAIEAKKTGLEKSVEIALDELQQLGKEIRQEQISFNKQLGELYKIHQDLNIKFNQLKHLHEKATSLANHLFIPDERKAKAQAVLKLIPDKMIHELEKQLEIQQTAIDTIFNRLNQLAQNVNGQSTVEASESEA